MPSVTHWPVDAVHDPLVRANNGPSGEPMWTSAMLAFPEFQVRVVVPYISPRGTGIGLGDAKMYPLCVAPVAAESAPTWTVSIPNTGSPSNPFEASSK